MASRRDSQNVRTDSREVGESSPSGPTGGLVVSSCTQVYRRREGRGTGVGLRRGEG